MPRGMIFEPDGQRRSHYILRLVGYPDKRWAVTQEERDILSENPDAFKVLKTSAYLRGATWDYEMWSRIEKFLEATQ